MLSLQAQSGDQCSQQPRCTILLLNSFSREHTLITAHNHYLFCIILFCGCTDNVRGKLLVKSNYKAFVQYLFVCNIKLIVSFQSKIISQPLMIICYKLLYVNKMFLPLVRLFLTLDDIFIELTANILSVCSPSSRFHLSLWRLSLIYLVKVLIEFY